MNNFFSKFARKAATVLGSAWAFLFATVLVIIWALSGPVFGFSDTWELVINTATTIITFLMVFLIQNTQNHDSKAIQLKLDELIESIKDARNEMIALEDFPDEKLEELEKQFQKIRNKTDSGKERSKVNR